MKYSKHLLLGVFFGIVLSKAEVVSWYRIYEMFRFDNFSHVWGNRIGYRSRNHSGSTN